MLFAALVVGLKILLMIYHKGCKNQHDRIFYGSRKENLPLPMIAHGWGKVASKNGKDALVVGRIYYCNHSFISVLAFDTIQNDWYKIAEIE